MFLHKTDAFQQIQKLTTSLFNLLQGISIVIIVNMRMVNFSLTDKGRGIMYAYMNVRLFVQIADSHGQIVFTTELISSSIATTGMSYFPTFEGIKCSK